MAVIAHISDLHFGRERSLLIDALMEYMREINPQLVIISGDLTQRAARREFRAARDFLDGLQWPSLVIAGNHDIPAYNLRKRFFQPWQRWLRFIQTPLEPLVRGDDYVAIGVNTARRMGTWLDWSRGRVNIIQLGNIVRQLREESEERLRIVVAHHPFWLPETHRFRHIEVEQSVV